MSLEEYLHQLEAMGANSEDKRLTKEQREIFRSIREKMLLFLKKKLKEK